MSVQTQVRQLFDNPDPRIRTPTNHHPHYHHLPARTRSRPRLLQIGVSNQVGKYVEISRRRHRSRRQWQWLQVIHIDGNTFSVKLIIAPVMATLLIEYEINFTLCLANTNPSSRLRASSHWAVCRATLRHTPRQDITRPSSQGLSVNGMGQDRTALQWGGSGQKTCATFFIHPSRFPRLRADKTISPWHSATRWLCLSEGLLILLRRHFVNS